MRKLLLASVALLGISSAIDPAAYAQMSVQYGDGTGDDSGQGAPAPGTITVRLNGRFQFFAGGYGNSDMNDSYYYDVQTGLASYSPFVVSPTATAITAGVTKSLTGAVIQPTTIAPGVPTPAGFYRSAVLNNAKVQNYGIVDVARLYPGFDGVAANGLKYGASFELRSWDYGGAGGNTYSSPSQAGRERDLIQFRRAYGYVGTDQLGTLRFGMTDGPSSLFLVGNFENFNSGGWNGAIPASFTGQLNNPWPFPDVGAEYTTNKVVYLSPQIFGFDLGVSYAPDSSNLNGDNGGGCENQAANGNVVGPGSGAVAGSGCDLLSSSTIDYRRFRNLIETAVRYRGSFGPVGVAAFADYSFSGKVNYSGAIGGPAQTGGVQQYKPMSYGLGGGQLTYAGFSVGGMGRGGNFNDLQNNEALQPEGTNSETAYVVGGSYTTGPLVVGAHYFHSWQAGFQTAASKASGEVGTMNTQGIAAGGTYSVAPGLAVYLEYLWGQMHQRGVDLDLNIAGAATHNTIVTQYLGVGTGLSW
jgi:predicted porin